jgi:hypothetical protein
LRHTDLLLLGQGELRKLRFEGWGMGYSEINVLSLANFHEEVSLDKQADKVSCSEAIIFLLAACA